MKESIAVGQDMIGYALDSGRMQGVHSGLMYYATAMDKIQIQKGRAYFMYAYYLGKLYHINKSAEIVRDHFKRSYGIELD